VPCGIAGKRAISLERALGRHLDTEEVRRNFILHFGEAFERTMISVSASELEETLAGGEFSAGAHVHELENMAAGAAKGSQA